jgi:hypothetical protein
VRVPKFDSFLSEEDLMLPLTVVGGIIYFGHSMFSVMHAYTACVMDIIIPTDHASEKYIID